MEHYRNLHTKCNKLEKELIGRLFSGNTNLAVIAQSLISPSDLFTEGAFFETLVKGIVNNKNVINIFLENKKNIADYPESYRPIENICEEIKELSNAIKLADILKEGFINVPDEKVEDYIADIQYKIINTIDTKETQKADIDSIIKEYKKRQDEFEEKKKNGGSLIGFSCGYEKIDQVIDGIREGHLWIIGGYTNMGKSFASLNIVANVIKQNKRVVFYSLEMVATDILSRIIGILEQENGNTILKGYSKKDITNTLDLIRNTKLSVHGDKLEISKIIYSIEEEYLKNKPDLIVIDFLQLVTKKGGSSEYETTTEAILQIQSIAKKLKIPIIVLSQVSNDSVKNSSDIVMGFKGSGAIAAAADLAIELVHGEQDAKTYKQKIQNREPVTIKWIIKKNRHGRNGTIEMSFNGDTGTFIDPFEL